MWQNGGLARTLALGSFVLAAASVALGIPGAQARVDVGIGIGLPGITAPPIVEPPPAYYYPQPVVYVPPTYYYAPGPYSRGGGWWIDWDGGGHWRRR